MRFVQHAPSFVGTFSRAAVRELDRVAINEFAIPGIVLMENAAAALEEVALQMLVGAPDRGVLICCGPGNNGGDGLALARRLHNRGHRVALLLAAPRDTFHGDALTNLNIASRMTIPTCELDASSADRLFGVVDAKATLPTLIVDSLFGTGLDRPIGPPIDRAVRWVNSLREQGSRVLAVDLPSGLDCDTGEPLGEDVIRADVTLTLAGRKRGFDNPASRTYTGRVEVGDIGVPVELLKRFDAR